MGMQNRDWYKDHFKGHEPGPSRDEAPPSTSDSGESSATASGVLVGVICAVIAAVVFTLGLLVVVLASEAKAIVIVLAVLWLPAGVLAAMSYRLLRRRHYPLSRGNDPVVTSTVLGITTATPRSQLMVLYAIGALVVIVFVLRGVMAGPAPGASGEHLAKPSGP